MQTAVAALDGGWMAFRPSPGEAPSERPRHGTARIVSVSATADLVSRCRSGDQGAFRELFRVHRDDVARLVYRMLGSSADVPDLVQEVFLQVHRSIGDFRGDARFSTWLYRLTVNVVLMHRRAARSRPQLVQEATSFPPEDPRLLPDEQVTRKRRIAALYRLVERLSEKKRTVFVLHELEGMTPAEIAKVVAAPVLTVRTRLFYARREMLDMMRQDPALSSLVESEGGDAAGLVASKVTEETT